MGSCTSISHYGSGSESDILSYIKVSFQPTFTHPTSSQSMEVNTFTFKYVWNGMNDWQTNNTENEHLRNVLYTYMKYNVCIDKYFAVIYRNRVWTFHSIYNDGIEQYRVLTILPPKQQRI